MMLFFILSTAIATECMLNGFDFSAIHRNDEDYSLMFSSDKAYANPCGKVKYPISSHHFSDGVVQDISALIKTSDKTYLIAQTDTQEIKDENKYISFTYTGVRSETNPKPIKTKINVYCYDETTKVSKNGLGQTIYHDDKSMINFKLETDTNTAEITLLHSLVCKYYDGINKNKANDGDVVNEERFPTTGLMLLLFTILIVLLYLFIGGCVNYIIKDKKGKEIIPNSKFWFSLPSLVWDGIVLVFCCRKKNPFEYFTNVPYEEKDPYEDDYVGLIANNGEVSIDLNDDLHA